jgi:hypothetical protein
MNKHFRFSGSTFSKLEELGVRASAVCAGPGCPGTIRSTARAVSTEELFALWRAVGEVSTISAIGLLLGTEKDRTISSQCSRRSFVGELRCGHRQMARYKQLTCPEEILQDKDDEEWSIQFRWLLADEVEPRC